MKALKINWSLFAVAIMALSLTVGCAEEKDGGGKSTKKDKPKGDVETFVMVPGSTEQEQQVRQQRAEQARRGAIPGQQSTTPNDPEKTEIEAETIATTGPTTAVIEMERVEKVESSDGTRVDYVNAYSGTNVRIEQTITVGSTMYSPTVDTQTATYDGGIEITFGNDGSVDVQVPGSGTTSTRNGTTTSYPRRDDGFDQIMADYNTRVEGTSTYQGGGYPSTLQVYEGDNGSGYHRQGGAVTQQDGETVGPAVADLDNRPFNPASFTDWLPEGCDVNLAREKYCFFRYLPDRKRDMNQSAKDGKCHYAREVRTGSGIVVDEAWLCKKRFSAEEAREKAREDWIFDMPRDRFEEFREAAYYMLEIREYNNERVFQFDVWSQGAIGDFNNWWNNLWGQQQDIPAVNLAKKFFDRGGDKNQYKVWKFMYQCMDYGWRSNDWYYLRDKDRNYTVSKAFDNMYKYFDNENLDDGYFVEESDGTVTCKYARCNDLGNGQYHCPDDMPEHRMPVLRGEND